MKVVLEGTGGPGGWPEPGCGCASCARVALPRRPTSIVVDDVGLPGLADGLSVTGSDGRRLLIAGAVTDPAAEPYDMVLIDVLDRPHRLGALRRDGAIGPRTRVVAIGLDHRVPSEAELGRRLAHWGVTAVPDGTVLDGWSGADPAPPPPRRTLLLGGSRSGKSEEAELRLAGEPEVVYVATGPSRDGDDAAWKARVLAHQERRPAHWRTEETIDLVSLLATETGTLLIDGLGTWLAAVYDELGAWRNGRADLVAARCDALVAAWRQTRARVVAVSDEVGLGVVPATASGLMFRDALGRLNQRLAAESEEAALVVAGRVVALP
ncbi:bifunctional adenosylcobinamide kinase/adenosylcobinamide-phosphate guanylyltransferase [Streptosporangiaceae bacterium NEAU-GS5]|nr:bifunctional adenosylcobinamide kinase/adenosylcobinamide-phosphate guanylyltransferase [Streptosporangiaceae bacterium NEAU-GS5]